MNATFLIDLDVGDDTDLISIAEELADALESRGFIVVSSRPWSRKTLADDLATRSGGLGTTPGGSVNPPQP